jgi:hypothetical protein
MSSYHEAFVRHAKKEMPKWQFDALHHKARSAAGGSAPRNQDMSDEQEIAQEMGEEPDDIRKLAPDGSEIHVPVPLGSEEDKKKKKRPKAKTAAVPPDGAEILSVALEAISKDASLAAALEAVSLSDEWQLIQAAMGGPIPPAIICKGQGEDALLVQVCKRTGGAELPIVEVSKHRQILYCVALEPDSFDFQGDAMDASEIEKAAHTFMEESRIIGRMHSHKINALPIESYIAPQDLSFDGINGRQLVRKGSWVLGIKIADPAEWQKVLDGEYRGISVGGTGYRKILEGEL